MLVSKGACVRNLFVVYATLLKQAPHHTHVHLILIGIQFWFGARLKQIGLFETTMCSGKFCKLAYDDNANTRNLSANLVRRVIYASKF